MKKTILLTILFSVVLSASSQIAVESFRRIDTDKTAITADTREIDQNGEVAALIKVVTTQQGFTFDGGMLGIVKVVQQPSEIWVYVPRKLQKISIAHPDLGILRDYYFPVPIEGGRTYELVITAGEVITTVQKARTLQYLTIRVTPSNATLYVDDELQSLGAEGTFFKPVSLGSHTYRLEAAGFKSTTGVVEVKANEKADVAVELQSLEITTENKAGISQYLTIRVTPPNATLYIDDELQSLSPKGIFDNFVSLGNHTYRLQAAGYKSTTGVVEVKASEKADVAVELQSLEGTLSIECADKEADIVVNEEVKGRGSWKGNLFPGMYIVEARRNGHRTITEELTMGELENKTVSLDSPTPIFGSLNVLSDPMGAMVFVDNKRYEETPCALDESVGLLVGSHEVKLTKEGYLDYTVKVILTENEETVLSDIKLKPGLSGHEYVDLGLSVQWATCNVGASSPEDYGDYFAWGETTPKSDYSKETLKYRANVAYDCFTKYVTNSEYGTIDSKEILEFPDDAARQNWGGSWRMPTKDEFDELLNNCTWTLMMQGGHNGYKVTSKSNGNSIFLPAAGSRIGTSRDNTRVGYWSSSLYTPYPYDAWLLSFSQEKRIMGYTTRWNGLSVRPVFKVSEKEDLAAGLRTLGGTLSVECADKEADIVVNEEIKGRGNWKGNLLPGMYIVEARRNGHRTITEEVTIGELEKKTVTLASPTPIFGRLRVESDPVGAMVFVDNKRYEETPCVLDESVGLLVGSYEVKLTKEGYADYTVKVVLKENEETALSDIKLKPGLSGHEYVDLGLSVHWATCNVGASSPEDYGDYFAWGETTPKSDYSWKTLKYCKDNDGKYFTKYSTIKSSLGIVDNKVVLELSDDAAHVNWGGNWCMPTKEDFYELLNNCSWTWTTQGGHKGYRVTSKSNGNSIFLPAAGLLRDATLYDDGSYGLYWSSSLNPSNPKSAVQLRFRSWGEHDRIYFDRLFGQSVRPVWKNTFTLSVKNLTFTSAGGIESLLVTSNQSWTVSSDVDWLTLSQTSGTGDAALSVTAGANTLTASRWGSVTFSAGGKEFTVTVFQVGADSGSHEYVDLGLSVKWATCNVGASSPEDYGDYFAWGEITTKDDFGRSTYKCSKYNTSSDHGTIDNKTVLELEDDAACQNWGGSWRMPTIDEFRELLNDCTWKWTKQGGHKGYKVTSKSNGNSIFLPAAGYRNDTSLNNAGSNGDYWSSSLNTSDPNDAWGLNFDAGNHYVDNNGRRYGLSVRPVCP